MSRIARVLIVVLALGVVVAAATYPAYRRDLAAASERVAAGGSVVETACGTIEYAVRGQGPPVLMVHGAGGGYDQGLLFASLIGDEFTWIVPSRFGYLGTPLPAHADVESQADAHACLLDALGIDRAAVVGVSAGGPSSLQFALRHPERCVALVMMSAVSRADPPGSLLGDLALRSMLTTDLFYWLMMTAAQGTLVSVLGITPEAQAGLSPEDARLVSEILMAMLPVSLRRDGILFDMRLPDAVNQYPLDRIVAPTLVVHARDDALVRFDHAEHTATIPGARTVFLPEGGHFGYAFRSSVTNDIAAFLGAMGETEESP